MSERILAQEQLKAIADYLENKCHNPGEYLRGAAAFRAYAGGERVSKEFVLPWKVVCCPDGLRIHSAAAGRWNRCCKRARSEV